MGGGKGGQNKGGHQASVPPSLPLSSLLAPDFLPPDPDESLHRKPISTSPTCQLQLQRALAAQCFRDLSEIVLSANLVWVKKFYPEHNRRILQSNFTFVVVVSFDTV